jgi:aspartyl-tRNA synthetase
MTTWRTHMAGEPTSELVGEQLTLAGWVARRRDHGGLIFVDLRDRSGITQLVINPELAPEAAELAHQIRNEFVLRAEGTLVARSPETVNPNMPTGEVELRVETLEIVSRSTPLPFQLDEENVDETLRLRHRWLDLRREKLQRNITLRAQMVGIIRREMEAAGFLDIQTPILFKPTPEGARDFVVPARLQEGRFYALPQSPQILKQLTMVAGFDRYYQIAICFRDEDLRADRVQEITQLDVEMSFPDQELLYATMERMYARIWRECLGIEIETPFPRMTFAEADRRFGTDKPDTRFALELEDATEVTRASEFGVFKNAEAVRFLRVPQAYSRGDLGKLEELAKEWGANGLAYLVFDEEGEVRSPIAKFLSEAELAHFRSDPGSTVLFAADGWPATSRVLGALRSHVGQELGLIDEAAFTFLWVYDFPMFERDEDESRWTAVHHPFTRPTDDWKTSFADDPEHALAHAYDLIVNGNELGGGSFRIHEPEIQAQVFELLGMSEAEQRSKFGFLLDALGMGAPPMGGIALGIDRMTMVLAGEPNLRDVIAFPKNQAGVDPMSGAPSEVTQEQLDELGIQLVEQPD